MKIRPVGAELFRADGRTDGYGEANSRFLQFLLRTGLKTVKFSAGNLTGVMLV
jgi:hypothetical protein